MSQINDITTEPPSSKNGQPTEAWGALSQYLPTRDPNSDYWWGLTGRQLATLVEAAGYPIEKQYEALLFHYHWTVPTMGQAPRSDGLPLKWKSLLSLDGTPIEYSWKWNTRTREPDVRYVIEPIGQFPGTRLDALNQQALRDTLHHLSTTMTSVDTTWANHFLATLYDHDNAKYVEEAASGAHLGTTIQLAAELLPNGIAIKTYFFPRKLGQNGVMPLAQWESAIAQLDPKNMARAALHDFMASSSEGKLLAPFSIGVDNVAPAKSRLKWYFRTPHTSFKSVRDIMTLGGRRNTEQAKAALDDLHDLIKAILGLPSDFSEDTEPQPASHWDSSRLSEFGDLADFLSGYLYYFDIAPGNALPDIKIFIPVRYYAHNDLSLARGLMAWMEARGRGRYCERYLGMLESLADHRSLEDGNGLQTYVSCLLKGGELDITTYLGAEAFHPGRLAQRRATRRRGD